MIHGIRDKGFWTQKIARAVKEQAETEARTVRSFTGTYGYFAIVPFLAPWIRHWKTGWLMDQYVLMRALYPKAKILLCRTFERHLSFGARSAALSGGEIPSRGFRGQRRALRLSMDCAFARRIGKSVRSGRQGSQFCRHRRLGRRHLRESISGIDLVVRHWKRRIRRLRRISTTDATSGLP